MRTDRQKGAKGGFSQFGEGAQNRPSSSLASTRIVHFDGRSGGIPQNMNSVRSIVVNQFRQNPTWLVWK